MALRRSGVRVQSAASSRLGIPTMASHWISPNHPSPITPLRTLSMLASSKVLERQLARHHDVARSEAAVDGQRGASDSGGVVGSQEGDGAGDVLWLDDAPQRIPAFKRREHFRVLLRSLGP